MAMNMAMGMAGRTQRRHRQSSLSHVRKAFSSADVLRTGLIALAGILAVVLTLQVSLAGVYRLVRPAVALKVAPYDATARAKLAEQLLASKSRDAVQDARDLAIDALRRDPLQPAAVRVLAQANASLDAVAGSRTLDLMLQSQRLSKRDLKTQMWLVDYYSRGGNSDAMLQHVDIALRTSETARTGVFALLDAATFDPSMREALLRVLSKRPNWVSAFASFEVLYGTNLDFAVRAARLLLDPRKDEDRLSYAILLQRLADQHRYELAWRVYTDPALGFRPGPLATVRNGDFETPEDSSRFDWSYSEEPDLWASKEGLADHGVVLRLAASNGRSGEVARQILHLSPGPYQLFARIGDVPSAKFERPEFRIECAPGSGTGVLLSYRPNDGAVPRQAVQESFVVPPNCTFQRLSINIAGEGAQKDLLPWVDDVSIRAR